jgi:hypothetical protein
LDDAGADRPGQAVNPQVTETWRRLQPLRVASGWMIDMNSLYAVDPSVETADWLHGSVLISGHLGRSGLCFDVRFEPEGDPEGCYVVDFLRLGHFDRGGRVTTSTSARGPHEAGPSWSTRWSSSCSPGSRLRVSR